MSLPFLANKNKMQTGLMVQTRKPDGEKDESTGSDHAMEAVAEDMIRALHSRDSKALAQAIRAAFEIADSSEESQDLNEQEQE